MHQERRCPVWSGRKRARVHDADDSSLDDLRALDLKERYSSGSPGTDPDDRMDMSIAALAKCRALELTHESVSKCSLAQIAVALQRRACRVETLVLKSISVHASGAVALASALKVNRSLRSLQLWFTAIDECGGRAIAAALQVNTTLLSLDIRGNAMETSTMVALADAMRVNRTLQTLILRGNDAQSTGGVRPLAYIVRVNTALTTLDLGNMGLQASDGALLADALRSNTTLRTLRMSDNELDDDCCAAFAAALRVNRSLHELDLHANRLRVSGATALVASLEHNRSTLQTLDLRCNEVNDPRLTEAIAEAKRAVSRDLALVSAITRRRDLCELNESIGRHLVRFASYHVGCNVLL